MPFSQTSDVLRPLCLRTYFANEELRSYLVYKSATSLVLAESVRRVVGQAAAHNYKSGQRSKIQGSQSLVTAKVVPEAEEQTDDSPKAENLEQENSVTADFCTCLISHPISADDYFQMVDPNYRS